MKTGIDIRCPIHGFIKLSEWEREIIDHPVFQRLRRIRQLGWTDFIYPGAMHTRFEHSLGVMHTASMMFDAIVAKCGNLLKDQFEYNDSGFAKDRQVLRLAALLHDVGHGPFSHAGEALMPYNSNKQRFQHEDYSASAVRFLMKDVGQKAGRRPPFEIKPVAIRRTGLRMNRIKLRRVFMKLLSICLFAAAFLTFLSGCASDEDSRGYSPGQIRAQHSTFDPHSVQ